MRTLVNDTVKFAAYDALAWGFAIVGMAVTRVLGIGRRIASVV